MKYAAIVLAVLAVHYRTYTNARFGFTVQHPSGMTAVAPPEDGDGRQWLADRGFVQLTAFGTNNVDHRTPAEQAAVDARGVHVTYRHIAGAVVTVSGTRRDHVIFYERDVVGKGSIDSLVWWYPARQKARWDAAVTRTARTFRPGDVSRSH
jgi:hypothetical protein